MVDIMRVMPMKKVKKGNKVPKQEDVSPSQEVGLTQAGEPSCFYCGDGHCSPFEKMEMHLVQV